MTRHLTIEELHGVQRNAAGRLLNDPQQLLRADRHLADCAECRRTLRSMGGTPQLPDLLRAVADGNPDAPLHPEYEQMVAYIDGGQNASEREWMTDHLSACRSCMAEVKDLRGFDARMLPEEARAFAPQQAEPDGFARWAAGVRGWFQAPGNARFALSSLALIIVGVGVMANVQMAHPEQMAGQIAFDGITQVASHEPVQFYAGLLVAALGLGGIVYRLRK